ncbi:MAG: replication factor C large subunit [Candidatus Micrarchaeota archaeon]
MTGLWTEKFIPKEWGEFIGNSELLKEIQLWSLDWNKKKSGPPLLLFGSVGSGKTALALLTAKLNDWDLFELNASDFRDKDTVEKVVGAASQNASFSGKLRLILLDEVDSVSGREDRGGLSAILQVLKEAKNPVILTANDIYANKQLAVLRNYCKKMEFKKINYLSMAKRIRQICEGQKIDFDHEAILELAKQSNGDFRSALLDLQSVCEHTSKITLSDVQSLGYRERQDKIFSILPKIFHAKTVADARNARQKSDLDDDLLFRWIEENLPSEFKDRSELALAFNRLSRADIFLGRVHYRQYFGFWRYSSELMTSGVGLSHGADFHPDFIMYKFPGLLSRLAASSAERNLKMGIAEKAQEKMHASKREIVSQDIPFWLNLFDDHQKAVELSALFNLDENEIAFLMQSAKTTKKVQKVAEEAVGLRAQLLQKKQRFFSETENAESDSDAEPDDTQKQLRESANAQKQTRLF